MRLNKYIANAGICSRRKADELIDAGKVLVNQKVMRELGYQVDEEHDEVMVAGKKIKPKDLKNTPFYIMLNKPIGYISSTSDKQGESVIGLITPENAVKGRDKDMAEMFLSGVRLYPVGRLDKDSEGLVLLTNDGSLANYLMHPRHEHEKEYELMIDKMIDKDEKNVLESGMNIGGEWVGGIKIKKVLKKGKRFVAVVVLHEGKNRQIRRMFGRLGFSLYSLRRVRMGKLYLSALPVGKWRFVKKSDIL